jgi:hypothetical protein
VTALDWFQLRLRQAKGQPLLPCDAIWERQFSLLAIDNTDTVDSVPLITLYLLGRKDMAKVRTAIVAAYLETNESNKYRESCRRLLENILEMASISHTNLVVITNSYM